MAEKRTPRSGGNKRGRRESFGSLRVLPSGNVQVRYTGPDGRMVAAEHTFTTRKDAETYLALKRADIARGTWEPVSSARPLTFGAYAEKWLPARQVKGRPLAARTLEHYRKLLDQHILPTFADVPLKSITPEMVDGWYESAAPETPTLRAHAYSLLRTILATAIDRGHITTANPAKVRGRETLSGSSNRGPRRWRNWRPSRRRCLSDIGR